MESSHLAAMYSNRQNWEPQASVYLSTWAAGNPADHWSLSLATSYKLPFGFFSPSWHRSEGSSELCGRVQASKTGSEETWGSLDVPSNLGAISHMDGIFCPRRCEFLLMLCIWILSSWVNLSRTPTHSLHTPLFLSFPPCFYFYFFLLYPSPSSYGSPLVHIPFLHSLEPAAAAAASSSSDFRMGPFLWSLSAARVQRHLPSTLRSVKLCSPCMPVLSAEAFCSALNRWSWTAAEFQGQVKLNLVPEVCIPIHRFTGFKGGWKWLMLGNKWSHQCWLSVSYLCLFISHIATDSLPCDSIFPFRCFCPCHISNMKYAYLMNERWVFPSQYKQDF